MKRLYRYCLGCLCLGVFLTNGVKYLWNSLDNTPLSGIVSMASWILMWIFLATQTEKTLTERDKFHGAFTMGVAVMWLLYHIVYGAPISEDLILIVLFLAIWFFSGAVTVGLWWSEVSPGLFTELVLSWSAPSL